MYEYNTRYLLHRRQWILRRRRRRRLCWAGRRGEWVWPCSPPPGWRGWSCCCCSPSPPSPPPSLCSPYNHSLFLSTLSRQLSPYTWQCTPHSVRVQQLYFSLYSLRWTFLHSDRKLLAVICVAVSMAQQWFVAKASVYKLSQKLLQLGWHYSVKFANVSHYCRHPFCHIGCKKF